MSTLQNEAAVIETALSAFKKATGAKDAPADSVLVDMLFHLMSYADQADINFSESMSAASERFINISSRAPIKGQLSPDEFMKIYKGKGWKQSQLADRWELSPRRIRQIKAEPTKNAYYVDAVFGLPDLNGKGASIQTASTMSSDEFKAIYKAKGWDRTALADRWDYKEVKSITNIQANPAPHFVDAVHGLPDLKAMG